MNLAGRFAVSVAALAIVFLMSPSHLVAQPPGGGGGFRGGRGGPGGPGGFFGGGGTLGLIQQQEVQQEIELSEDQEAELRTLGETIRDEMRSEMQGLFQGMRDLGDEERQAKFDEIRTRFEEINKDAESQMQKMLMPHQFDRLKQIEMMLAEGRQDRLTKKEFAGLAKEQVKLDKNLKGIRNMKTLPDVIFVVDTKNEAIAVAEARKLRIPVVGIVDTNCNPDFVDYVIPGNDDALRSIRLFASKMADAIIAGRSLREAKSAEMAATARARTAASAAASVAAAAAAAAAAVAPAVEATV